VLSAPQETRFDLRFRAFGFPVRVSPWFWLGAVLLAPRMAHDLGGPLGPAPLLLWVGVVFVSILLHELGHAVVFRRYGTLSHIVLHGLGGLAIPDGQVGDPWRQIRVSLAGPAVNFAIGALVWASDLQTGWSMRHELLALLYAFLYWANVGWGVFNLLPVWPLDGGQVCRQLCYIGRVRQPVQTSLKISIWVAVGLAVLGVMFETNVGIDLVARLIAALPEWFPTGVLLMVIPGKYGIVFMLVLAFNCYQELQALRRAGYGGYADDYGDRYPWQ
jgi:Zn-dependent protease